LVPFTTRRNPLDSPSRFGFDLAIHLVLGGLFFVPNLVAPGLGCQPPRVAPVGDIGKFDQNGRHLRRLDDAERG
jgi:hypothetical protein